MYRAIKICKSFFLGDFMIFSLAYIHWQ